MIKHYVWISIAGDAPAVLTAEEGAAAQATIEEAMRAAGYILATDEAGSRDYYDLTGKPLSTYNDNDVAWLKAAALYNTLMATANPAEATNANDAIVHPDQIKDVSRYVTEFTTDGSVNTESEPTKVKIVLANINRMFDDVFTPQKDHFRIEVEDIRYINSKAWYTIPWKIAVGLISDVSCDSDYCTINGTCLIGDLADALPIHWSTNGQNWEVSKILKAVLQLHRPPIEVDYQASDPVLEQKLYDAESTFQEVIDDCVQNIGAVVFVDEVGILHVWDASKRTAALSLDHRVTEQNKSQSLMNYINLVTVHGDKGPEGTAASGEGAENSDMQQCNGDARNEASIAKYGELSAEDIYIPTIKTNAEAKARAEEILNFLHMYRDGLTSPTVVGMAPYLMSEVTYHCKDGYNGKEVSVAGVVTRRKVNYSGESGFTTSLEISPGGLAVMTPEELAEYIATLPSDSDSNNPANQ